MRRTKPDEVTPESPESIVQSEVVRLLRLAQGPADPPPFHVLDSRGSEPGFPDVVACIGGRLWCIEVKTASGVLKTAQLRWLMALARCGATWFVATPETLADLAALLGVGEGTAATSPERAVEVGGAGKTMRDTREPLRASQRPVCLDDLAAAIGPEAARAALAEGRVRG